MESTQRAIESDEAPCASVRRAKPLSMTPAATRAGRVRLSVAGVMVLKPSTPRRTCLVEISGRRHRRSEGARCGVRFAELWLRTRNACGWSIRTEAEWLRFESNPHAEAPRGYGSCSF